MIWQSKIVSVLFSMCFFAWLCLAPGMVAGTRVPGSATGAGVEEHIRHALTYYSLGMEENGNIDAFRKALFHLDIAEKSARGGPAGRAISGETVAQIEALKKEIRNQTEVHHDTLYGVFPLVRLLKRSLFVDAFANKSYELVDDPAVTAATAAGMELSDKVLARWTAKPQLDVVVNSIPENGGLESELLYIFEANPKLFTRTATDVARALDPFEFSEFKKGIVTRTVKDSICDHFGIDEFLVVTIGKFDEVDGIHAYVLESKLWDRQGDVPADFIFTRGTCRDLRGMFVPIVFINVFLLLVALVFALALVGCDQISADRMNIVLGLTFLGFLTGRALPWFGVPAFGNLSPAPETLAILSFWWPAGLGFLLYIATTIGFKMAAVKFHLERVSGAEVPVLMGISLGITAYLAGPIFLYTQGKAYPVVVPLAVGGAGVCYIFQMAIGRNDARNRPSVAVALLFAVLIGVFMTRVDPIPLWLLAAASLALAARMASKQTESGRKRRKSRDGERPAEAPTDILSLKQRIENPNYVKPDYFDEVFEKHIGKNMDSNSKVAWLCIEGPAGAGKTAFARALKKALENDSPLENIKVLKGECSSQATTDEDASMPYACFLSAMGDDNEIAALLGDKKNMFDLSAVTKMVESTMPPYLSHFISKTAGEEDFAPACSFREIRKTVLEKFRKLSRKRPLIFFANDIQWIDENSESLLKYLHEKLEASENFALFLLTGTTRPCFLDGADVFEMEMPDLIMQRKILRRGIGLNPSAADEIAKKVQLGSLGGGGLVVLFQFVFYLAQKGYLTKLEDGFGWSELRKESDDLPVPGDLESILDQQLKSVSQEDRDILECAAACAGGKFYAEILAECFEEKRLSILRTLARLEKETRIIQDDQENDDVYEFKNPLILRMLRAKMNYSGAGPELTNVPQVVREYHRRLGMAHEKKYIAGKEPEHLFRAARHYYAAGRNFAEKGFEFCMNACKESCGTHAYRNARKYVDMASECAKCISAEADMELEKLSIECEEAHVNGNRRKETADKVYEYCKNKPDLPPTFLIKAARACYDAGCDNKKYFEKSAEIGRHVMGFAGNLVDKIEGEQFVVLSTDKESMKPAEKIASFGRMILQLKPLAEKDIRAKTLLARICDSLANLLLDRDERDLPKAEELFGRSIEIKKLPEVNDLPGLGRSYGGLGRLKLELRKEAKEAGNLDESKKRIEDAREFFLKDLEISDRIDDLVGKAKMHSSIGECFLLEKDFEAALNSYKESFKYAKETPDAVIDRMFALAGCLRSAMELGRCEECDRFLEAMLGMKREIENFLPVWASDIQEAFAKDDGCISPELRAGVEAWLAEIGR